MRTLLALAILLPSSLGAQATRAVYLDSAGVVRWRDDRQEVTLFGANYVLPTASDYRAAGYLDADRKRMIDEDMAQFARMGWDGLRLTFWGDWEASDTAGNLIQNDHLDLQDYLIARARERGIYMLFSPIQLYGANWPDALRSTGCTKLVFYNVSQDFRIGEAIRQSRAQGVTFGWYPTGLNSGHELEGNYLRTTDSFPDMLRPELARLPRIVYEFDSPDLRTGTMYPAMARTIRAVGGQAALMFAYDMQGTASRNLGWQTH